MTLKTHNFDWLVSVLIYINIIRYLEDVLYFPRRVSLNHMFSCVTKPESIEICEKNDHIRVSY